MIKAQEKLDSRKEDLFKKQDITKWELDPGDTTDKVAILQNKELAIQKMLPKETSTVKMLKLNYGFYLNRIIEEYQRLRELTEKITRFAFLSTARNTLVFLRNCRRRLGRSSPS